MKGGRCRLILDGLELPSCDLLRETLLAAFDDRHGSLLQLGEALDAGVRSTEVCRHLWDPARLPYCPEGYKIVGVDGQRSRDSATSSDQKVVALPGSTKWRIAPAGQAKSPSVAAWQVELRTALEKAKLRTDLLEAHVAKAKPDRGKPIIDLVDKLDQDLR